MIKEDKDIQKQKFKISLMSIIIELKKHHIRLNRVMWCLSYIPKYNKNGKNFLESKYEQLFTTTKNDDIIILKLSFGK